MPIEIQQLAQLGGTVSTVLIFVYYLSKKDQLNRQTYQEFNNTITSHLVRSSEQMKEVAITNVKVAERLEQVSTGLTTATKMAESRYNMILKKLNKRS